MISIFALADAVFGSFFRGKRALVLENLALRQQLAVYKRVQELVGSRAGPAARQAAALSVSPVSPFVLMCSPMSKMTSA